jgi:hypothetical protein
MEQTTSCQIQGLDKNLWLKFRKLCLSEGISAAAKVRAMIEELVAATDLVSKEEGKSNER